MCLASIATVAVSLLILSCAWLLVLNSGHMASAMESELEINAYLRPEITREDGLNLKRKFEDLGGVAQVTFISKEDGLKSLQERFDEDTSILDALGGNNPLPDMYRIKAEIADDVPRIAGEVEKIPEVENVRYGQGVVEKLLALTNWMVIGLAAVFLIATSIRITVFARRREIGIMKLVGATDWYIRWPFFLEGMMVGLVGAVLAILSLHLFYSRLVQNVILTLNFLPILNDTSIIVNVYKWLLFIGTFLGAAGSAISLRRFLKV
jgi:cell division transport system permease protein